MLRIDVTPEASSTDPVEEAAPVVAALRRQSGYREIAHERTTFGGLMLSTGNLRSSSPVVDSTKWTWCSSISTGKESLS